MLSPLHILTRHKLILARFSGTYSTTDGQNLVNRLLAWGNPEALAFRHLYDLSEVQRFDADFGAISSLVSWKTNRLHPVPAGTLCVIFAPGDVAFGMARMYQSVADDSLPFDIRVTRSEAEALAELGDPASSIGDLLKADTAR